MSRYRHIFFDLDHTLWDFDTNSKETLIELYAIYGLESYGFDVNEFIEGFIRVNHQLWDQFNRKKLTRDELRNRRFTRLFEEISPLNPIPPNDLSEDYISNCPNRPNVIPGTHETLEYLKQKYLLHIITNGFHEIQFTKLKSSKIDHYFTHVVTSKESGAAKPDREAFEFILKKAGAVPNECVMVGDDLLADMNGARMAGIDQVYFNPKKTSHTDSVTFEITDLRELMSIL